MEWTAIIRFLLLLAVLGSEVSARAQETTQSKQASSQQPTTKIDPLTQKTVELVQQGQYAEATATAERALQGRYAEAEPLFKRALAVQEKASGPTDPNVALILHSLGDLYKAQGRLAEAEPLYQRALPIGEQTLGANDANLAIGLEHMAACATALGKTDEAAKLEARAQAIHSKAGGSSEAPQKESPVP